MLVQGKPVGAATARQRSDDGHGGGSSPAFVNALVGLRQAGKAENAMNALQSMTTARVRRDGAEAEIPAEQVVADDVVLITAGDEVPADGRIVTSSALQIDEPALTGESVPAAKDAGSGVLIVTETGSGAQVGKIAHVLSATAKEETPLTPSDPSYKLMATFSQAKDAGGNGETGR